MSFLVVCFTLILRNSECTLFCHKAARDEAIFNDHSYQYNGSVVKCAENVQHVLKSFCVMCYCVQRESRVCRHMSHTAEEQHVVFLLERLTLF